jgi:hypothetical protein
MSIGEPGEYVLEIKAYSPETFPMGRLAAYMADLARLLGSADNVHFVKLLPGSTQLVHKVEPEAVPKVRERVTGVRLGNAAPDALVAFKALDQLMKADNTSGALTEKGVGQVIAFPGASAPALPDFGIVSQHTILDGRIIRMGGKGKVVPVLLETDGGYESHCEATREMARELREYYDGPLMRFSGNGKWHRGPDGWVLNNLLISFYEVLDDRGLIEVVSDLRQMPNARWAERDIWSELRDLRGEPGDDE